MSQEVQPFEGAPIVTPVEIGPRPRFRGLRAIRRYPVIPLFIIGVVVLSGLLAPWIQPHEPNSPDLLASLEQPVGFGGDWSHPLGTDELGRDVLSRVISGARISLLISLSVVLGAGAIGTVLALVAGYFGGILDAVISRITDVFLSVPFLLVAIAVVGAWGASTQHLVVVLVFMTWSGYARVLRGEVLRIRNLEFVKLARVAGCSNGRILFSHILPNIVNPLVILATLQLSAVIIIEASLSYLGLGVPLPQATWGGMLAEGKNYIGVSNAMVIIPGVTIALTCLSINLFGDWLRVRLDPRFRQL
ncbi:MAG: ABC transporter permease [Chloroflexi bacterium]|nr:ABC transporter permease [Chloroflexota bacterium]